MKENKFRGKRVDNGEWVYGQLRFYDNDFCEIMESGEKRQTCHVDGKPFYQSFAKVYEVDPATVGQYTGKTVKTGPVCQDDIGKSIDGLFLIVWDEEKAAFMMQFLDGSGERLYLEEMWEESEIIGNLHDNPELLEGGQA